jgi:hypothetical protein
MKPDPHPRGWPIYIMVQRPYSKEDMDEDCVANWLAFHIVAVPPPPKEGFGSSHCHWVQQLGKWDHVNHAGTVGPGGALIPWSEDLWNALCKLQEAADHLGKRLRCIAGTGDVGLILDDAHQLARVSPNEDQCAKCGEIGDDCYDDHEG